jgi:hypothetical protein
MEKLLFHKIHELLNEEKFIEARALIEDSLSEVSFETTERSTVFKFELYGLLIDIGCEGYCEKDLLDAIKFFETNEELLLSFVTKASYYYNLANAKAGLGNIFMRNNLGIPSINIMKEHFQEIITLYWLAYKNFNNVNGEIFHQILINLSNALITNFRIVEGLQFLDIVLNSSPNFSQALISKGDALQKLEVLTSCAVTTSLFTQIYFNYDKGIIGNILPTKILQRSIYYRDLALNTIKDYGFDVNDIEKEIIQSEKEFNEHSSYRKYCISNFLSLNEHGIYCNCIATKTDNLQIGVRHGMFTVDVVLKLELLLNRMKSEFAFARLLYYQSLQGEVNLDYDVKFSELLDGEIINSQTEMLRSSYRLCYGILDKIALGICKLYNLDSKRIHFETFWDEPNRNLELNKIKNVHLISLYSIACDLNTSRGELKHFKDWRNKLEHNLLVLKDSSANDTDVLKLFEDKDFVTIIDVNIFKEKALHLLQLTRAAIFSYVFCVRLQTIQERPEGIEETSFVVDFKTN